MRSHSFFFFPQKRNSAKNPVDSYTDEPINMPHYSTHRAQLCCIWFRGTKYDYLLLIFPPLLGFNLLHNSNILRP